MKLKPIDLPEPNRIEPNRTKHTASTAPHRTATRRTVPGQSELGKNHHKKKRRIVVRSCSPVARERGEPNRAEPNRTEPDTCAKPNRAQPHRIDINTEPQTQRNPKRLRREVGRFRLEPAEAAGAHEDPILVQTRAPTSRSNHSCCHGPRTARCVT